MARRFVRRSSPRKKRDLVWVTIKVNNLANDINETVQSLLDSTEWTAVPGVGFERATLLRVVGNLTFSQLTGGTLADGPELFFALQVCSSTANAVDPSDMADVASADILHIAARALPGTQSQTNTILQTHPIDITAKRKLNSDTIVLLTSRITTDTVSPTVSIQGVLRFLIDRN